MSEKNNVYMTSNIDEAAYLVCRGGAITDYLQNAGKSWVSFELKDVLDDYRRGFGNVDDKEVGVAEFIAQRNIIKAHINKLSYERP